MVSVKGEETGRSMVEPLYKPVGDARIPEVGSIEGSSDVSAFRTFFIYSVVSIADPMVGLLGSPSISILVPAGPSTVLESESRISTTVTEGHSGSISLRE